MTGGGRKLRIAFLVPDNRDEFGRHSEPDPIFGPAPDALLAGLAKLPECEVHIVCCSKKPMPSPAKLGENLFYHSMVVPQIGWMRSGYWGCVAAIRRKLREIRPDVVHGQGSERYCAMAAAWSGHPNLVTLHGNMGRVARILKARPLGFHWMAARLERHAVKKSGGVLCITSYTKRQVEGLARRTWVVPNALRDECFSVPRDPVEPPRIVCVANVSPYKNQMFLIRTLAPLAREMEFELRFLGHANGQDEYSAAFRAEIPKHPWLSHGGFADREQMRRELAAASLSILPTLEDNCPMAVLEAFGAGVPVIANNVGGIPDLVDDGSTGILVEPRDGATLRAQVKRLLGDRTYASELATRAWESGLRRFKPEVVARKHLEIYETLKAGRSDA